MHKFTETVLVNVVIVCMLLMLFGVAQGESTAVQTFGEMPIYRIDTQEKTIALMINVYQGEEYVKEYLELFKKENIKVTFFIGGCWAEKNRDTVKLIQEAGHEIGNHGYNHKLHTKLTKEESILEITRTNALIKEITGEECMLFAPPSGDINEAVASHAEACGMKTVMWSADTIDWRDQDKDKIFDRVRRNLKPGALVLMHPTAATLEALPEIILLVKSNGYVFNTVGELLK